MPLTENYVILYLTNIIDIAFNTLIDLAYAYT